MSFGEIELEYILKFSKILVIWGKFKETLRSKTGRRDRDGGALGASLKAQEADLGIHTAEQRGDGCVCGQIRGWGRH